MAASQADGVRHPPVRDVDGKTGPSEPSVTWLELFYDLMFGAAILLVFGALSKSTSLAVYAWYAIVVLAIFALWTTTTLANNRVGDDTVVKRILVLLQMAGVIVAVMTVGADGAMDDALGVFALGVALLAISGLWWRVRRIDPRSTRLDSVPAWSALLGGVILCSSLILPERWAGEVFAVGIACGLLPIFLAYVPLIERRSPLSREHLRERLGQFTLIVLGEAFLEIVVHFTDGAQPRPAGLLLTFAIVTMVWWQYFSYIGPYQLPADGARLVSNLVGHGMVLLGIGGAASALASVALTPVASLSGDLSPSFVVGAVCLSFALGYAGLSVIAVSAGRTGLLIATLLLVTGGLAAFGYLIVSEGRAGGLPRPDVDGGVTICAALLLLALLGSAAAARRPLSRQLSR